MDRQKHGEDRQTDRQADMTEIITYPHTWLVIREIFEKKHS